MCELIVRILSGFDRTDHNSRVSTLLRRSKKYALSENGYRREGLVRLATFQ